MSSPRSRIATAKARESLDALHFRDHLPSSSRCCITPILQLARPAHEVLRGRLLDLLRVIHRLDDRGVVLDFDRPLCQGQNGAVDRPGCILLQLDLLLPPTYNCRYIFAITCRSYLFSSSSLLRALRSISSLASYNPTLSVVVLPPSSDRNDCSFVSRVLRLFMLLLVLSMCCFRVDCTLSTFPSMFLSFSYMLISSLFSYRSFLQSSQSLYSASSCSFLWAVWLECFGEEAASPDGLFYMQ